MDFTGKHAVVTGGTGALGTAVVGRLLAAGATCHVPNLVAAELDRYPHVGDKRVHVTSGIDLTDEAQVEIFYGGIDPLWASVHCAGGFAAGSIAEVDKDAFLAMIALNTVSCYLCCRAAISAMDIGGAGGRIVNVAARPALEPRQGAGMIAYATSKSAVAALTQSLAEEVAGKGIWVNAVAPSILDTPANRAAMPKADHARWPTVEDVAETIVYLASPENRTARGGVIPVYGRS